MEINFQLSERPCRRAGQPALSGVISDLIFTFTPAFSNCFLIVFVQICPAQGNTVRRNNLLKYRPIPPLTGGNFLLWLCYGLWSILDL